MRRSKFIAVWAIAFLIAIAGCANDTIELGEPQLVDGPAAPGSMAPNLAVGLDGQLYLSWIESREEGDALLFSTWSDGAWSTPRTIAEGDDWFVNWADFPSMAALEDGTLAAHWLVRSGEETYAYDVVVALSRDGGVSWSDPIRPHRDETQTEHGFVSLFPTSDNTFGVVWLDGRKTVSTPRGAMTLRYATLLPDGSLTAEAEIDESVCDCCSTDSLHMDDGTTLVAYRDRTTSEVRDISVSLSDGPTWSPPRSVHEDNWEIAACPVNGPAVAGQDGLVAAAWFTAAQDAPLVRVAFSRDGGRTFERPIRVDQGNPLGRVDVELLADASALVTWLERSEEQARIVAARVDPSGTLETKLLATTSAARSSGFPRMARLGNKIILAWTEPGEPSRIATAVLSM